MSVETLLARLSVPPVPSSGNRQGTDIGLDNQSGSPGSPGSLEKACRLDKIKREPPPLSDGDQEIIHERIEERAAIIEFDSGDPRPVAEAQARSGMRVFRVRVAMGQGELDRWVTLLAPGCTLDEATGIAHGQFGAARVLQVVEHRGAAT